MNFWTCQNVQKRPQAPKHIFVGPESEKYGNQIPNFENSENMRKMLANKLCRMALALLQTSS